LVAVQLKHVRGSIVKLFENDSAFNLITEDLGVYIVATRKRKQFLGYFGRPTRYIRSAMAFLSRYAAADAAKTLGRRHWVVVQVGSRDTQVDGTPIRQVEHVSTRAARIPLVVGGKK
jgi:hypothetical protein